MPVKNYHDTIFPSNAVKFATLSFNRPECHVPFLATDVVYFPRCHLLLLCRRLGMYICEGDLISISLKYFAYLITHFNVVGRWLRCTAAMYGERVGETECVWLEKP